MSYPSISQYLPDPLKITKNIVVEQTPVNRYKLMTINDLPTTQPLVPTAVDLSGSGGMFAQGIVIPSNLPAIFNAALVPSSGATNVGPFTGLWSVDSYYFRLPTAKTLISLWGGTFNDQFISTLPGLNGRGLTNRMLNQTNQVFVGDVFTVPIYNLCGRSQIIVAGEGGTIANSSQTSPTVVGSFSNNSVDTAALSPTAVVGDTSVPCLVIYPYNYNTASLLNAIGNISVPGIINPFSNANTTFVTGSLPQYTLTFVITALPSNINTTGSYTVY